MHLLHEHSIDYMQDVLPKGVGIILFGILTFIYHDGSMMTHLIVSFLGAILIATLVRFYRLYVLDKLFPLNTPDDLIDLLPPEPKPEPVVKPKPAVKKTARKPPQPRKSR